MASEDALPSRKMVIVRIQSRICVGGPAIHTILLSEKLSAHNFQTVLVGGALEAREKTLIPLARSKGIEVVLIPEMKRGFGMRDDLVALAKLYRLVRRVKPDIVHTHTGKAGALGRLAAFFARTPVIVHTFHGHTFYGYFGALKTKAIVIAERLLAKLADRLIVLNGQQLEEICRTYKIAPEDKFKIIPLGFELEKFLQFERYEGHCRGELGISDQTLLVGTVGRLVPVKNIKMLLEAAAVLLERYGNNLKFLIVGDGEQRDELQRAARDLGVNNAVIFTGWKDQVERIYTDLDVVALTSLNEGTPVSLIEAMAAARPVVATDVGGVRGIVTHGVNGLLTPPGDVDRFAEALDSLLADKQLRSTLGYQGRTFVQDRFRAERLLTDIKSEYMDLLRSKRSCSWATTREGTSSQ